MLDLSKASHFTLTVIHRLTYLLMYRISQLARLAGLSRSTVLYYEKLGLVKGKRSANGYRYYHDVDLQRLTLVQQLQVGGLTLNECKACIDVEMDRSLLEQRLKALDQEISKKQQARALLAGLLGQNHDSLRSWHDILEATAPDAHGQWLQAQGLNEKDALHLRWLSRNLDNHQNYMDDFDIIYAGLERLGPGSEADTLKALREIKEPSKHILDIGCGTGAASLVLAQHSEAVVTVLDNNQQYLEQLELYAEEKGLSAQIKTCCASMTALPFANEAFDLIWCEGSVYIMSFSKALKAWQRHLAPEGYLVVSDLVWTGKSIPDDIFQFWQKWYPDMQALDKRLLQCKELGYTVKASHLLGEQAWSAYIVPLQQRISMLEPDMPGSQAIADLKAEFEILNRFDGHFSYMMMVLQKS